MGLWYCGISTDPMLPQPETLCVNHESLRQKPPTLKCPSHKQPFPEVLLNCGGCAAHRHLQTVQKQATWRLKKSLCKKPLYGLMRLIRGLDSQGMPLERGKGSRLLGFGSIWARASWTLNIGFLCWRRFRHKAKTM